MNQKRKYVPALQLIFMLCSICVWMGIGYCFYKREVDEKSLILCSVVIVILFYSYLALIINKNRCAYKQQGRLLQPNVNIPLSLQIVYMILISLLNINNVITLWNGNTQLTSLTISLILTINVISLSDMEIIIIGNDRIYFHHTWLLYENIRKIDTDHTAKKYTVVYLFEKKMYTQRLKTLQYQEFKNIIQQYYHHEYNDTDCLV